MVLWPGVTLLAALAVVSHLWSTDHPVGAIWAGLLWLAFALAWVKFVLRGL